MKQVDTTFRQSQQPDTAITSNHGDTSHQPIPHATNAAPHHIQEHFNTVIPETLLRPNDSIFQPQVDTTDYILLCNDSAFAPYKDLPIVYKESMFVGSKRHNDLVQPTLHHTRLSSDWIFTTIILLLAFISLYINNQKFKIKDIFQSLFDTRVLDRVFRESNIRTTSLLPMVGIYFASIALVIIKIIHQSNTFVITNPDYIFYLLTLAALSGYILLKNGIIRLLGNIFEDRAATMLYISSNNLFYFIGGLISVPLLLFLFFCTPAENTFLRIILFLIGIIFIVRVFRGIQLILTNSKTSKLYLFYYLCIFEIVPILVMVKVLLF